MISSPPPASPPPTGKPSAGRSSSAGCSCCCAKNRSGAWRSIFGGWFIRNEARQGYRQILWRDLSKRVPTIHAAFLQAPRIPATRLLDEAVDDVLEGLGQGGEGGPSLVVNEAGRAIGLLGLDQVRAIKRARWTAMTAGDAMLPLAALPTLPANLPLDKALAACVAGRYSYALVIGGLATDEQGGPAIGIITPARITRHLAHGIRTRRDPSEPVTEVEWDKKE